MKIKRILFLAFVLCLAFALFSCGMSSGDDGPQTSVQGCQHQWTETLVREANCQAPALYSKQCSKCQESTKYEEGGLGEHDLEVDEVKATCTENGYRNEVCKYCGYTNNETLYAAHNYEDSEWVVTVEPDENYGGMMIAVCSTCHDTQSISLPVLNDTDYDVEWIDDDNAIYTYSVDGHSVEIVFSNFEFRLLEGEGMPFDFDVYVLTGYEGAKSDITLPATYKGCPVIAIDSYAFQNASITSVVIPEPTFTYTRDDLTGDVPLDEFPEGEVMYLGYQSIGYDAFLGCSSLTSVSLPESITSIPYAVFKNCSELSQINLEGVKNIGESAFDGCTSLSDVDLSGATYIGLRAFSGCSSLESLLFGDALAEIDEYAFENCTALSAVVLPNGLETVGSAIFLGCTGIEEITLPRVYWGSFASLFSGEHYSGATYYSGVDASKVPAISTVTVTVETAIPEKAFENCAGIEKIVVPTTTVSIGNSAFRGCSALEEVVGCDAVTSIGEYAFYNCYNLDGFSLSNNVESIGRYAFGGVNAYNFNQDFDNKTYYIGNETNPYLYLLCGDANSVAGEYSHVEVRDGCRFIATNAFGLCDDMTAITIPASVEHLGVISTKSYITNDQTLEIYYDGTAKEFTEKEFSCSGWYLRLFVPGDTEWVEVTDLTVSDNLTEIPDNAYAHFINIETVRIPEGVTSIGARALSYSHIKNVYLPKSITSIGGSAFYSSELENVYYYGTVEDWCKIEFSSANDNPGSQPMSFAEHFYMLDADDEWAEVTEITVPDTVTEISEYLFLGFDNLTKLVIHEGVTEIYTTSYYDCPLLTVYYEGSKEQWENILTTGWVYSNPAEDTTRKAYYMTYEPSVNTLIANPGVIFWHYNSDNEVEEWSSVTNYADGKTYVYSSSSVVVSDTYWDMMMLLKEQGMLEETGLPQEDIDLINNSATKADYEANLVEYYGEWGNGLTVSFADGQVTVSQGTQAISAASYVEIDGEIYNLADADMKFFTVDTENSRIFETITDDYGYITVYHYYNEVVAE